MPATRNAETTYKCKETARQHHTNFNRHVVDKDATYKCKETPSQQYTNFKRHVVDKNTKAYLSVSTTSTGGTEVVSEVDIGPGLLVTSAASRHWFRTACNHF